MTPTTRHWLIGVIRALTTGTTAGGSLITVDGILGHHIVWREVIIVTVVPAVLRLLGYLRRHPWPGVEITEDQDVRELEITEAVTIVPKQEDPEKDK